MLLLFLFWILVLEFYHLFINEIKHSFYNYLMNLEKFNRDLKEQVRKVVVDELSKDHKKWEINYSSCDLLFQLLQDCKNEYKQQSNTKCKLFIQDYKTYCSCI